MNILLAGELSRLGQVKRDRNIVANELVSANVSCLEQIETFSMSTNKDLSLL